MEAQKNEAMDTVQTSIGVMEIFWPGSMPFDAPLTIEMRDAACCSTWITFELGREGWRPRRKYHLKGDEVNVPAPLARELTKIVTEWARDNQEGYGARCREDFATFIFGSLGLMDDGYIPPTAEEIGELLEGRLHEFISPDTVKVLKKAKDIAARIEADTAALWRSLSKIQGIEKIERETVDSHAPMVAA